MEALKEQKEYCPHCGSIISLRKVALYSGITKVIKKVYDWCNEKQRHEFKRCEINHLLDSNAVARWGDLVLFGGIFYKSSKGYWGMNKDRCESFLRGDYKIPKYVLVNPITREITKSSEEIEVDEIDLLSESLDEHNQFVATYYENKNKPKAIKEQPEEYHEQTNKLL